MTDKRQVSHGFSYEENNQKIEVIPMKRVDGKLVKPEAWEAAYSQLFVDQMRDKYMAAIKRQAETISDQGRELIMLRFKVDELTAKIAQLNGVF